MPASLPCTDVRPIRPRPGLTDFTGSGAAAGARDKDDKPRAQPARSINRMCRSSPHKTRKVLWWFWASTRLSPVHHDGEGERHATPEPAADAAAPAGDRRGAAE